MKNLNLFKSAISFLAIILISSNAFSQTVTVDGYAFLEGQTGHDSIQIVFERLAPGVLFDTVYTDTQGYYSIDIETGVYSIIYSKNQYIQQTINDISVFSNITLSGITLESLGLSGNLSGTLVSGIYKVGGDISIEENDTLIIEPGVTIKFTQDTRFIIHGLLLAEGTIADSIRFTRYNNQAYWKGVDFWSDANSNSVITYAIIEYSNNTGLRISESSPTITSSIIRYNSNESYGGGIFVNESNSLLSQLEIYGNQAIKGAGIYCAAVGEMKTKSVQRIVISNCLIYNNLGERGAGVYFYTWYFFDQYPILINSVISGNISTIGGAIEGDNDYIPNLVNNVICNNQGYGVYSVNGIIKFIGYNDIYGNEPENFFNAPQWVGEKVTINNNNDSCDVYFNILMSPEFIDVENNDFHFQAISPCIDAGINDSVVIGYDFDGNYRIWDGNNDGTAIVDMGVYEFGSIPATITSTFNSLDNICIPDTAFIEYTGNATDTANYFWGFDGGTIISGSGQGPYEISWTGSGEKIISLFLEENGMTSETSTQTVNVIPLPTVYAGQDATAYAGGSYLISNAEAENYESLIWSTSGDGYFDYNFILHPVYFPGQNDISNENVILTLTVNSPCGIVEDDVLLSIEHLSLSGSVYTGNDLLGSGVVLIFDIDENYYLPVQFTAVTNGGYNFENLDVGNYLVYAIPNPFEVTGYFPAYYVNQLFWWDAYEIDLFGNAYDVDIHLVEIPENGSGNGSISGVVTYESPEVYEEEIYENDWFDNTTGSPYGAWNIPVFLFDEQGNTVNWALSDESGIFEFTNLSYGQYTLTMEKAGFQLSDIPEIILDENNPTVSNVEIAIESGDISIDVNENSIKITNGFVIYPNPVSDELNIEFDKTHEKINIELFNQTGQKVFSKQIGIFSQNAQIDVSFLGKGIYIGMIKADNKKHYFKILK